MANVSTNIRIDSDVKQKAAAIFNELGMDMTTAVNISFLIIIHLIYNFHFPNILLFLVSHYYPL